MKIKLSYFLLYGLFHVQLTNGQDENHLFVFDGQLQWTNPAVVGFKQESNLGVLIDSQWLGIKDAPKQQSVYFESYRTIQNLNLGGVIRNRARFGEQNIQLVLQSAYPLQLKPDTFLHLGFQITGDLFSSDYTYLRSVDGVLNDPLLLPQKRFLPNLGLGFSLFKKNFWIQAAVPRLLDQYFIKNNPTLFLRNTLYFFGGIGAELLTTPNAYSLKLNGYVHNLAYDRLSFQLKGTLGLRFGELIFGINSSKNMGIGFQLSQRDFLKFGYFFQFPYWTTTELNKTNHSLSLLFKLSTKNNN
jgi:type IX secretion system PorP/SprF family membrane protein